MRLLLLNCSKVKMIRTFSTFLKSNKHFSISDSTTVLGMLLLLACFLIFEAYIYNNAKTSELNREPVFGREFEVDDEINWNHHQIELLNEKIDTLENMITKLVHLTRVPLGIIP